jgi:hypothetical protein
MRTRLFGFLPADISEAILGDLEEEARRRLGGRWWIHWQLLRSSWPLIVRATEREGLVNVALWFFAGYFFFAFPLVALSSLRDFVLTQVPLRTGADPGPVWMAILVIGNVKGVMFGSWLALRRLGRHV